MKKLLFVFIIVVVLASCNRGTCPAYMNGGATGTMGEHHAKPMPLFGHRMK